VSLTRPQGERVINKHLQSPDGKSSMQIKTNMSLRPPAKPLLQEQRAQQIKATVKPRWQEQHVNKYKQASKSTWEAPVAKPACTTN